MISPSDEDYQQTKLIKEGELEMPILFQELSFWIAKQFSISVPLNIRYDQTTLVDQPRLQVIFEREEDESCFRLPDSANFDRTKKDSIASCFKSLIHKHDDQEFETDDMFVIFSVFEPIARWEANSKVTELEIARMVTRLSSPLIWKIRPMFGMVAIFLHTEWQLKMMDGSDFGHRCRDVYSKFLKQYDEFGYFKEAPIFLRFDSKENFEQKYNGSWFYYDR